MSILSQFDQQLTASERRLIASLDSPFQIQSFLDELTYSADSFYRCPLRVLRERTAHCFDGALFAAATLRRLGFPPLILDMLPNERDDDHLLALFKIEGHWGAIAKSNFSGLRFREPIHRSLRELVLSYFEQYYNVEGEKTLRGYTRPLKLTAYDRFDWMSRDEPLERIANHLDKIPRFWLLSQRMIENLAPVDRRTYQAGMLGVNEKGLFRPGEEKP